MKKTAGDSGGSHGGGALVTALCIAMYLLSFGQHLNHMIIGSIMPLIPGVAFSLLFGVPTRYYPYCGFIGGAGWFAYAMLARSVTEPTAALAATIAVLLLSRYFVVLERCPVTIFLISGIFPLVPGAGVYWTA